MGVLWGWRRENGLCGCVNGRGKTLRILTRHKLCVCRVCLHVAAFIAVVAGEDDDVDDAPSFC